MGKKKPKSKVAKQLNAPTNTIEILSSDNIDDDIIAAAISTRPQTVLMKVCRLCETKDGPFLNIFDADKVNAKKIEEVMPFGIAENDDLPHKICFRCSAKVEELYEFIQKCIKTQENLQIAVGKTGPVILKTRTRALWEEKLNKTNLSNEDICNAMIKKAMEGIKEIPLNPLPQEKPQPAVSKKPRGNIESSTTSKKDKESVSSKNSVSFQSDDEHDEINLKQVKLSIEKCDEKMPITRSSRLNKSEPLVTELVESPKKPSRSSKAEVKPENEPPKKIKQYPSRKSQNKVEPAPDKANDVKQTENQNLSTAVSEENNKDVPPKAEETPPPINIMDHVSTIKVNGVGTLFLCKLCNRNFLKKEVVMTHGCARNNVPKDSFLQNHVPRPEIPKPSTVKYIKMDKDFKKTVAENKTVENKPVENKLVENKPVENNSVEKNPAASDYLRVNFPVQPEVKLKPKVGPASRVKGTKAVAKELTPPTPPTLPNIPQEDKPVTPSVQFPGLPCLNSRYKLVPGPNNTFTLVEDSEGQNEIPADETPPPQSKTKKRKSAVNSEPEVSKTLRSRVADKEPSPEVIELDDNIPPEPPAIDRPYPVGLFQTVPHHSGVFPPNTHPTPPAFTTPAMKKQSYTIVQTGNPSKLLISTKPQAAVEEPPRKKSKKTKLDVREVDKEHFDVPVEETTAPKDAGFFTFINVDPLLQPSYVLPTDNIIQESQISTSTPASKAIIENKDKDKYACNMCGEKFSREKKLLAHIQSHYNQMDEEDQLRAEKTGPKRKTRKS